MTAQGGRVLVAGAGIAGLGAALALARRGFAVTLVERSTRFEEAGAGLQLSPNASRVLVELGVGPSLARHAVAPDRLDIRGLRDARLIGSMPLGATARERYGAPFWVARRADLQTVLLDAVRALPSVRLLVGREIAGVEETGGRVRLRTRTEAGQEEALEGIALVGADGLRSRVRPLVLREADPVFSGYEAWRALLPAERAAGLIATDAVGLWLGQDAHLVHYPVGRERALNLVLVRRARAPREGWSAPGDPADLAPLLTNAAEPLRALIGAVDAWQVWSLHDRPAPKRLARGRLALAGDAGHPVLPFLAQGGALAIEDAAILAACLAAAPDDPVAALRAYSRARTKRVARVRAAARANARSYHLRWPLTLARDAVIRALGPERMLARYDWLYGWRP